MSELISKDRIIRLFDEWEKHAEIKWYFHHKALRKHVEKLPGDKDKDYIQALQLMIDSYARRERGNELDILESRLIIIWLDMAKNIYTELEK